MPYFKKMCPHPSITPIKPFIKTQIVLPAEPLIGWRVDDVPIVDLLETELMHGRIDVPEIKRPDESVYFVGRGYSADRMALPS